MAPISLLPPEVLARVFHHLSLQEPPCSGKWDLGWMRATHVCRFWRQVALGDSSLWARISGLPTKRELVSEMLARAKNVPLDIDIDLGAWSDSEMVLMVHPHLFHTCELRLRGVSILHDDSVRSICAQEAPALEHFELRVLVASVLTIHELDGTTLFKGCAPRLRTVSLFNVSISWSLIPRGQLTQLKIYLSEDEAPISDDNSDLNQLFDLLVNCPELEVLVLESCLPPQLAHFPFVQKIHLSRLSRLCLGGSSSCITNMLKMLNVPTSTILHLHCTPEHDSTHNDHILLTVVSEHLQSPVPVKFKQLSVTLSLHSLEVTASTSFLKSRICESQDLQTDTDDEFVLSFDKLPRRSVIEQVGKIIPISSLEFLSIRAPDVFVPRFDANWIELFKCCPEITTFQAIGRGTGRLVRALTTPKLTNTRHGWKEKKFRQDSMDRSSAQQTRSAVLHANAPIFPKLAFLLLKNLDFRESRFGGVLFDVVEKGLRQRKVAYGAPLNMLCIDDCTISIKCAKALGKHVEKLDWDGESWSELEWEDVSDLDDTAQGEQ